MSPSMGDKSKKYAALSGEETMMALKINGQSSHEVVDVMHAGVDTQDFIELSGSEHTIVSQ